MVSILIKIYDSLKKSKVGIALLLILAILIATTVMVFGLSKIIYHIADRPVLLLTEVIYLVYELLRAPYPLEYDPYISLIVSLFIMLIGYVSLVLMTEKKGEKRYFLFKESHIYVNLSEMKQFYIFISLTIGLTYFSLYYYSFPLSFDSERIQIFLWLGIVLGILWILLAVQQYIFIFEFLFCYNSLAAIRNKHFCNRLCNSLENDGEFKLSEAGVNTDFRDCVEKKLIKIVNDDSLSNLKSNSKVYIHFIKPFDQICKDRENILSDGLFLDYYFE